MKLNKEGKYRVNFYLNPDNTKDKMIIEYLNRRYSATEYIKELLYNLTNGVEIQQTVINTVKEQNSINHEEYEKIEELDDIEI